MAAVSVGRHAVGVWRRRWRDGWNELTQLECAEPARLRDAIRETFNDAPRSGCPGTFTAEQVTHILALAGEPPEKSGRPITHWTNAELRDEVVKRKIVPNISVTTVGHYLRTAALRPHRRKMWINTTEKDPVTFQRQVTEVCQTHQTAVERHAADGTRTVSIDEMTGLQALERAAPDKPTRVDQVAKQEFEYVRHGTTTLIGNWDVVQAAMFSETIGGCMTHFAHAKIARRGCEFFPKAVRVRFSRQRFLLMGFVIRFVLVSGDETFVVAGLSSVSVLEVDSFVVSGKSVLD